MENMRGMTVSAGCRRQKFRELYPERPQLLDLSADLVIGPAFDTPCDTVRIIDEKAVFIVPVDNNEMACGRKIPRAHGAD